MLNKNRKRGAWTKPIILKDYVWIGEGAIVAAGSVVNKDTKEFTVVGGVSARLIKAINNKKGS